MSHGARIRAEVSHDRCVGVGMCVQVAAAAFRLNPAGLSEFQPHGNWTREAVEDAADACPMSAITIAEDDGDTEPGSQAGAG